MNRTISLLLKSSMAFLFFAFQMQVFGQNTYYAQNTGGQFSDLTNWNTSTSGFGKSPKTTELTDGTATFVIQKNMIITLSGKMIIGSLVLETGGTLNMSKGSLAVKGDVTINIASNKIISTIDFGTASSLVSIEGNLNGGKNSQIIHTAGTQELALYGATNTLDIFTNAFKGISIVRYAARGPQTVFNSDNYLNLYLEGAGIKTLSSPLNISIVGTTVNGAFDISDCQLYLGTFNFMYAGTETNLHYSNGWVVTNGTGLYKNHTSESTITFPIGDATNMQALRISKIQVTNTQFDVRFGGIDKILNGSIPNKGLGVWYITSSQPAPAKITLIQPVSPATLVSTSKIALFNTVWRTEQTNFSAQINEYDTDVTIDKGTNSIAIFTCPTFTLTPTSLPEATSNSKYSAELQVISTRPNLSLRNVSSSPAGFKINLTDPIGTGITFENTQTGTSDYSLSFTVRDTLRCETTFKLPVTIKSVVTIWDGKSWSNGVPDASKEVIFQQNYTTAINEVIKAKNVLVEKTALLTVINPSSISISGSLQNDGTIDVACGGKLSYNAFKGNEIKNNNPVILPASLDPGIVDVNYEVNFTVDNSPANITIDQVPSGFTFTPTKSLLSGMSSKPIAESFTLTYSAGNCTVAQTYTIKIIDLPSPNLSMAPIGAKTVDDKPFNVLLSSRSKGALSYSISGGCATINSSNQVLVGCPGTVTIQVTQASDGIYKSQTITQSFVVNQGQGRLLVGNYGFLVGQNSTIKTLTKPLISTVSFDQLKGFNVATVDATGLVTPLQSGEFTVHISMAATTNYTAFDSVYTFNVFALKKPPIAVSDTIVLKMGSDSTFNILLNDKGMTEVITADQTDIDIDNKGLQVKFYATELGNFIIDAEGNLTVKPFYGFIGSGRLGYTVTDLNGLTSEIAYVEVIVDAPYVLPEIKANNVMTPNGDNLNDALVIANTDLKKENSLVIIDELGNTVYETTNYQNNWEGVDKKEHKLESGTYFYIFKEKTSGGREFKNYIQIVK